MTNDEVIEQTECILRIKDTAREQGRREVWEKGRCLFHHYHEGGINDKDAKRHCSFARAFSFYLSLLIVRFSVY